MANEEETLQRFESFKDGLCNGSYELQITISKQMTTLAKHLGPEFTRNQLLPFIKDYIDIHDEILLIVSEQLEHFIPLVGGYEHSQPILDILVKLCNTEETFVRERTVQTLRHLAEKLNGEQLEQFLLPVVETMGMEDDWFSSKCSAAALYPIIYQKVSEEKKTDIRNHFRALIQDDSPIVRRATALSLLELIPLLDDEHLRDQFIPVFDNITKDDMDSVRVCAVDVAIEMAKRLTLNEVEEFIFKTIVGWADDPSWKMRQRLAEQIAILQQVIPYGKTRGKILAMYQKLVQDCQCEVRKYTAKNLVNYCRNLKQTYQLPQNVEDNFEPVFRQSIVPQIKLLITDGNDEIRYILSSTIVSLSTILKEQCFKQMILPLIVEILEGDPSTPVQANILNSFDSFPPNVDVTQCFHSIRSVLRSLIVNSSTHWRTRRSLLIAIMHIVKRTTKQYFVDNLKIYYAALLGDPVFAVRRSAPIILPLLGKEYGMEWISDNVIQYFTMYKKDCRYLYRYVPLFGVLELIYPSLNLGEKPIYLKDLRVMLIEASDDETKTAINRTAAKISKLVEKIRGKFEQQPLKDILSLQNVNNFNSSNNNDDINTYAENIIEVINDNHKCDIFGMEKELVLSTQKATYLEGVLNLIYNQLLDVSLTLFEDTIVNIQIRAVHVINKIRQFTNDIAKELESDNVFADAIKAVSQSELDEIVTDIERGYQGKVTTDAVGIVADGLVEETIDTDLVDNDDEDDSLLLNDFEKVSLNQIPDIVVDTISSVTPKDDHDHNDTMDKDTNNVVVEESTNQSNINNNEVANKLLP